jgi:hypothetical protein
MHKRETAHLPYEWIAYAGIVAARFLMIEQFYRNRY